MKYLILIALLFSTNAFAQWTWQANSAREGISVNGTAENKQMAEQQMQAACQLCSYLEQQSQFAVGGGGINYFYGPPEFIPIEGMTPWEYSSYGFGISNDTYSSLAGVMSDYVKDPTDGCPAPTATDLGGAWKIHYTDPFEPVTRETYCLAELDYSFSYGLCFDQPIEIKSYTNGCSEATTHVSPQRRRNAICPEFMDLVEDNSNGTRRLACRANVNGTVTGPKAKPDCESDKDTNTPNPCNIATGDKLKSMVDYSGAGLSFSRHYNSLQTHNQLSIGQAWRHSFDDKLLFTSGGSLTGYLSQTGRFFDSRNHSGSRYTFFDGSRPERVTEVSEVGDEWHATSSTGGLRVYNAEGELIRIETPNGEVTTLSYNADQQLTTITNSYGSSVVLGYEGGLIKTLTQPDGGVIVYGYDDNKNLVSVKYPDTTPGNSSDNPTLTYHYEDPRFTFHLTGVTDENGERHQTYQYDDAGRATSSEKSATTNPVGQERFELDY